MIEAKIDTDKKIMFALILILLVGGIFGSYAYFSSKSETATQNINTGYLDIDFDDSTPIINNENIIPIEDNEIFDKATKKSFTITNASTAKLNAKIEMTNIDITENLKNSDFKWALYDGDNEISSNTFETIIDNKISILDNLTLDIDSTKTYDLYIWISNKNEPQDKLQSGKLNTIITVSAVQ